MKKKKNKKKTKQSKTKPTNKNICTPTKLMHI